MIFNLKWFHERKKEKKSYANLQKCNRYFGCLKYTCVKYTLRDLIISSRKLLFLYRFLANFETNIFLFIFFIYIFQLKRLYRNHIFLHSEICIMIQFPTLFFAKLLQILNFWRLLAKCIPKVSTKMFALSFSRSFEKLTKTSRHFRVSR